MGTLDIINASCQEVYLMFKKKKITASATYLNINHAYVATLSLDNLTNVFRFVSNSKNCLQINLAIKIK